VDKAVVSMYEVLKLRRKHNLSIKCLSSLFDKMVKPILLYGCEISGFGNNDVLEKVLLKFCKMILNLKTSTPNYMIYGELGRYPVEIDIKIRILEKPVSFNIFSKHFIHLISKFCCKYK
jgi:hypothetical protein